MHCISLAILSRLIRFPSPVVGTNWPFCVDVPLKHQSTWCGHNMKSVFQWCLRARWPLCVHEEALPFLSQRSPPFLSQLCQSIFERVQTTSWHRILIKRDPACQDISGIDQISLLHLVLISRPLWKTLFMVWLHRVNYQVNLTVVR